MGRPFSDFKTPLSKVAKNALLRFVFSIPLGDLKPPTRILTITYNFYKKYEALNVYDSIFSVHLIVELFIFFLQSFYILHKSSDPGVKSLF